MDNRTAETGQLHSFDATRKRWYWVTRVIIGVVTVIGNGLIVYIISSRPRLRRKNANRFILSLCTADLCTGVFITPAEFACTYKETCDREMELAMFEFFVYASALGLCALAFDRYLALHSSLLYQTQMTSTRVSLLIALTWFLPLLSSLLHFSYLFSDSDFRRRAMAGFAVLESLFFVALPCVVLPIVYVRILVIVRRHARFERSQRMQVDFNYSVATGNDESSNACTATQLTPSDVDGPCKTGQTEAQEKEDGKELESEARVGLTLPSPRPQEKCVILMGMVIGLFVTCWFFATYLHLRESFSATVTHATGQAMNISWLLILLNSALNPPVYAYLKKDIRRELRAFFGYKKGREPHISGHGTE